METAD